MVRKKLILLDEKTERALIVLCDVVMKFSEIHMATIVGDITSLLNKAINKDVTDLSADNSFYSSHQSEDEEW